MQLQILAGLIHSRLGEKDQALRYCETALALAAQLDEVAALARAYVLRGHLERLRGSASTRSPGAKRALREATTRPMDSWRLQPGSNGYVADTSVPS